MNINITSLEFAGAASGIAGTLLLATRGRWAGWGFVCYLASNAAWLAYSWQHGVVGLFVQQIVFALTSVVGVWTWLLRDRVVRRGDFNDTERMEWDICRRFDGYNAEELAARWHLSVGEVYDIVYAHFGLVEPAP